MAQGKRVQGRSRPERGYAPKRLAAGVKKSRGWSGRGWAASGALCALALCSAAELTAAYLHDQDTAENTFLLGEVTPVIQETFENAVKENVTLKNGGNTPVYLRAAVLVSWQDGAGHIMPADPPVLDGDYTFTGPETNWTLGGDGYYYYTLPVSPGGETSRLIAQMTDTHTDTTKLLVVDIVAQSVQASPAEAVADVFPGVTIGPDGTLTPPAREVTP